MKIWVISDPHWGHDALITDGFRPADYGERQLTNIGRYVGHEDVLICLGDVCWKDYDLWHERLCFLPCKRWLVRGNHDNAKSLSWLCQHGWDMVCDSFRLEINGKKILFSHYPMIDDGFDLNIHGHFHNFGIEKVKEKEPELYAILTPKHKLIAPEYLNYEPVKLQRIVEGNL